MINSNLLFGILLLCVAFPVLGQDKVDSLENELNKAEFDTSRINILIELAYEAGDPESQLDYARQAYEIGKHVQSIKHKSRSELITGIFYSSTNLDSAVSLMKRGANRYAENEMMSHTSNAYYIIGVTYEIESAFDSAILNYKKAYEIASESKTHPEFGNAAYALANIYNVRGKNVEALKWAQNARSAHEAGGFTQEISQVLNQIGIIYDQKGLYSEALDSYLEARDLAIQAEDISGEILINNNLGVIYDNMNNPEMALNYYNNALEKARIHDLKDNEATLLNNLSYIHLKKGDTSKSILLLKESLSIDLKEVYPCFESYPLEGMASIYIALGKLDSAEIYLTRAEKVASACEDVAVLASVQKDFGQLYSKQGKPSKARKAFAQAIETSRDANLRTEIKEALFAAYQFNRDYRNNKKAMEFLEKYQVLTDSIYNESNIEKATQLAAEYEFRKQIADMEREREEAEKKLTDEIKAKAFENRLVLLALVLFVLLAVTLARSYFFIQKQNKKLKWLNDEKNKLMGIVAHDLRNPLNMIIGLMPLFEKSSQDSKDKHLEKYTELLGASSERMRNMIDRVLDISAIENMKVNLKLEKTNLSTLTHKSIHNFDIIASQKEIEIIDKINKESECISEVDPEYLLQVIDNLLSNAIKFSERGKKIEVGLQTSNGQHEIIVKDEGPGISEEEQKSLFQAYTTLSSKPTEQERSTGLGLSIAHKFVEAMGGKILCHSKPGNGTSFTLVFDRA